MLCVAQYHEKDTKGGRNGIQSSGTALNCYKWETFLLLPMILLTVLFLFEVNTGSRREVLFEKLKFYCSDVISQHS